MTNDELKKKIAEIIDTTNKPCECLTVSECLRYENCKYQKREEWSCKAYAIADALIAAGIGDVETVQKIAASATAMAVLEAAKAEHRAEVAERALKSRAMCHVLTYFPNEISGLESCIQEVYEAWIYQAEKELAEEGER